VYCYEYPLSARMDFVNKDNPFYHNYIFSEKDLERAIIRWWEHPFLWLLPTYVQVNYGYAWFFKTWRGKIYFMKSEKLHDLPNF